jgi:hypothetical protein
VLTKNPQQFQTSISWSLSPKTSTRDNEHPSHIFGSELFLKVFPPPESSVRTENSDEEECPLKESIEEPWSLSPIEDRSRGMMRRLDPPSPLEVRRGILGGEPPPGGGRLPLRRDRGE